jgi:ribosomal protein S18 acetylase RimI-like enzyme
MHPAYLIFWFIHSSPYKKDYTKKAYENFIVGIENIENRIRNNEYEVLIAVCANKIVGTASIKMVGDRNLYLGSMAVLPEYQGKRIGFGLLEEAEKIASQKNCLTVTLETSSPLVTARKLYERFGFKRTGKERDLYGVIIFEMKKNIL